MCINIYWTIARTYNPHYEFDRAETYGISCTHTHTLTHTNTHTHTPSTCHTHVLLKLQIIKGVDYKANIHIVFLPLNIWRQQRVQYYHCVVKLMYMLYAIPILWIAENCFCHTHKWNKSIRKTLIIWQTLSHIN